jgi:hypothetical protein
MSRELRDLFGRAAGESSGAPDVDAAWNRGRGLRRRRRLAGALSATTVVALLAGVVVVGSSGDDGGTVASDRRTTKCTVTKPVPAAAVPDDVRKFEGGAPRIGTSPKTSRVVGHGGLWALAPARSTGVAYNPTADTFVLKFPWFVRGPGPLTITAHPANKRAPVVHATGNESSDSSGRFFSSAPELPSPGCWDVTARANGESLTVRLNAVPQYASWSDASGSWTPIQMQAAGFGEMHDVRAVVAGGPGYVAGGQSNAPARRNGDPTRATVWSSSDGRRWKKTVLEARARPGQVVERLAAGPRGVLAFGADGGDGVIWDSRDGRHWRELRRATSLMPGGGPANVEGAIARPGGWLAFGALESETGLAPAIWLSSDGRQWRRALSGQNGTVTSVIQVGTAYRAFGTSGKEVVSWFSSDGTHWDRPTLTSLASPPRSVATNGGMLLAVFGTKEGGGALAPSGDWGATFEATGTERADVAVGSFEVVTAVGDHWLLGGSASFGARVAGWSALVSIRDPAAQVGPAPVPMPSAMPAPRGAFELVAGRSSDGLLLSRGWEMSQIYLWEPPDGR